MLFLAVIVCGDNIMERRREEDYYKILGVTPGATASEVRAAFRRMSLELHPDRQAGKTEAERRQAEESFKLANAAYSVLSDLEKRKSYDRAREEETKKLKIQRLSIAKLLALLLVLVVLFFAWIVLLSLKLLISLVPKRIKSSGERK